MVLVTCIYDPAFYYTQQELVRKGMSVDVIGTVEKPQLHILAQSGSSDTEQMMYNNTRSETMLHFDASIQTSNGDQINDTIRYFHVDGPAQEFEIGHNRGGNYPCTACNTHVAQFDDLCHAYRKPHITLKDHQQFMLNGIAWKRGGVKPLDGLTKQELQQELLTRERNSSLIRQPLAPNIVTMKKSELQAEFNEQKKGFSNFPALLATNPTADLSDLHLAEYEVAPTEPLHD